MIIMQIEKFSLGNLRSNCYVVYDETRAFIVDPGFENEVVPKFLEEKGLTPDFIYITHGHYDHIGGVKQLKMLYPDIVVYAPEKDSFWIVDYFTKEFGYKVPVDYFINEPFDLTWKNHPISFHETPGHSLGGMALFMPNDHILFSGDTLFCETIGRTDIPQSDFETLAKSIDHMYDIFPDQTIVYAGHGRPTTIGHEKKYNPYVTKN